MSLNLRVSVRHNASRVISEVTSLSPRLDAAMRRGTSKATALFSERVISEVVDRTTMSPEVARRITESEALPGAGPISRGKVSFKKPPPGGWSIEPKNKQALSFIWRGRRVFFKRVQHPGSRPYKLITRSTEGFGTPMRGAYDGEVEEVL